MKSGSEIKVGLFVLVALLVIAYATVRLSDRGGVRRGGHRVTVVLDSAVGLIRKTRVEVAGIQVGTIEKLDLVDGSRARAVLNLDPRVHLGTDAVAVVRSKGFLGESYINLDPGDPKKGEIPDGGTIEATNPYIDIGKMTADAQEFVNLLKGLAARNEKNINEMVENFAIFSADLREILEGRKEDLSETMRRLSSVSEKIDEGRGTLGQLVNNEELAENLNEAARGVSDTVGGVNRFQFGFDYHLEYLGVTSNFKNYVGLNLKPRPDKYFRLEFVVDPDPSPNQTITTTDTTTGGVTTSTVADERVIDRDHLGISAQLAKSFYDFTFRGGLFESRGGVGIDWGRGPVGIEFSAFDFRTNLNQRPHLKALGRLSLTRNLFVVSGVDDIISRQQNPDWFVGAGLDLIDEDIKSLFSAVALGATRGR